MFDAKIGIVFKKIVTLSQIIVLIFFVVLLLSKQNRKYI